MLGHLRVLRPAPGVLAFYDGRVPGHRYAAEPNWVDEGALGLGIASYAIIDGGDALVYDTHISVLHAGRIREVLAAEGAERFIVALSHWHLDHVAGTEAFADCEVIACERTAEHLANRRKAIESGTASGPPAIRPLVLPTRTFADRLELSVGAIGLELRHFDIHSDDAAIAWLPEQRLLLAGDTLEDTVTYVNEPGDLDIHHADLNRLAGLGPEAILANHGDPDVIAAGGYDPRLIAATQGYIRKLQRSAGERDLRELDLRAFAAEWLADGSINYFEPYEAVHRSNVMAVAGA